MWSRKPCFLILSPGFPKNEDDTTCLTYLQSFVLSFKRQNPHTKLVVVAFQYPYFSTAYLWHDIQIISLGGAQRNWLYKLLIWVKAIYFFLKFYFKYDIKGILNFWLTECAFIGQILGFLFRVKSNSWAMGRDVNASNKFLRLLKFAPNNIMVNSLKTKMELNKIIPNSNLPIVSFGINSNYFDIIEPQEKFFDILGVGYLNANKNFSLFIKIIAIIKKDFPLINAAIIGFGDLKKHLNSEIKKAGLEQNICILDGETYANTIGFMKSSKVFLHTSSFEGQGVVLTEAIYCGMQVICFEVGNCKPPMIICKDENEMIVALTQSLKNKDQERLPILLKSIDETVKEVMNLYKFTNH